MVKIELSLLSDDFITEAAKEGLILRDDVSFETDVYPQFDPAAQKLIRRYQKYIDQFRITGQTSPDLVAKTNGVFSELFQEGYWQQLVDIFKTTPAKIDVIRSSLSICDQDVTIYINSDAGDVEAIRSSAQLLLTRLATQTQKNKLGAKKCSSANQHQRLSQDNRPQGDERKRDGKVYCDHEEGRN